MEGQAMEAITALMAAATQRVAMGVMVVAVRMAGATAAMAAAMAAA